MVMTEREHEFYVAARIRRAERMHRRLEMRRAEEARRARLDKIGEALLVPALLVGFYAMCLLAFL